MAASRFVVGIGLIIAAAGLFLFGTGTGYTSGAIALGVLGIIMIAISRRRV